MLELLLIYLLGAFVSYGYFYGSSFMMKTQLSPKDRIGVSVLMSLLSWLGVLNTFAVCVEQDIPHMFRLK